jgi:hypothetical protein
MDKSERRKILLKLRLQRRSQSQKVISAGAVAFLVGVFGIGLALCWFSGSMIAQEVGLLQKLAAEGVHSEAILTKQYYVRVSHSSGKRGRVKLVEEPRSVWSFDEHTAVVNELAAIGSKRPVVYFSSNPKEYKFAQPSKGTFTLFISQISWSPIITMVLRLILILIGISFVSVGVILLWAMPLRVTRRELEESNGEA